MKQQSYLEDGVEPLIPYGRILGFRREAAPLLKEIRERSSLAIIQRPVLAGQTFSKYSHEMELFRYDVNGADLYEQISAFRSGRKPVLEMVREQIIL